ncbi:MAG: ATP-binding protein [Desulfurivibrionaceae bacterium]
MQLLNQIRRKHSVRKKVLIPLSLTFAVLLVAFVWAGYGIRRADERLMLQQHFRSTQSMLVGLLKEDVAVLHSTAEFIAGQQTLQTAMLHQDLQNLGNFSGPLYERISKQLDITHFYFHDARGRLLLRVYFPEDVSRPDLRRQTMQRAMRGGRPESGLEIGRHGTFAQRLVFPWYLAGELIGYIELGMDLRPILDKLKAITHAELTIAIDKANLDRENWEAYAGKRHHSFTWDFMADKVVSDTTIDLTQPLAERIFKDSAYGIIAEHLDLGQRSFRGNLLPVTDVQGQRVGDLVILADVTGQEKAFYGFLFWVVGFSLLLSGTLFVFAYGFLGRVGRQLATGENLLRQESATLSQVNEQLQNEVDIRKQAEERLSHLNQTLERRVAERTLKLEQQNLLLEKNRQALENAYDELREKQAAILHQDKMACIGQLAAGVAHDINNPVGFISHNLTLFGRYFQRLEQFFALQKQLVMSRAPLEIKSGCEKGWRDFRVAEVFSEVPVMLRECQDGTTRITQIVQSLRTFIRSETPKFQLTDLQQCLDGTLTMLRPELEPRIRVVKDYQPIPLLYTYTQQMNQLFMNLLLNACQAITERGEIRIRTWAAERRIFIEIGDSGCGIPPELLDRIYEPFYTTKPIGAGTGLGLSIVYEVVSRHHGSLEVRSEVGRGTTFTLSFPADSCETACDKAEVGAETGEDNG